ncbi:hypothetical protein ANN_03163 [Periplaneta americana]|uniref:Uncharacterized protein n=1 Tax=Periplaneta americana TaxID=6978 RepID=A0ABQ8TYD0_PERAM|nr:hypothetical protein ANN_03163 [Periplaneta americana]
MLCQWLIPELDRVGLLKTVVLQQDGVPVNFWTPVREWLSTSFPSWIGRGGPLIWPPRSPELMPCDNWLKRKSWKDSDEFC